MRLRVILLVFALICCVNGYSQSRNNYVKFYVTSATSNGVDITPQVLEMGLFTVFYEADDGSLCMANYCERNDTQCYGGVYNLTHENYPRSRDHYEMDVWYFSWSYYNDYDRGRGTCQCEFIKIYKPQGVVSSLRMVTPSLDILEYTGYQEGSLDFSRFY